METVKQLDEDVRHDPQPGDDEPLEEPGFNEHGFRTLFRNLSITGIEGDIFKVSAIDYDASNPKNMAEVDGVMLGWYDSERDQRTYIHIKDLERILQTAKSKL